MEDRGSAALCFSSSCFLRLRGKSQAKKANNSKMATTAITPPMIVCIKLELSVDAEDVDVGVGVAEDAVAVELREEVVEKAF